MFLDEGANLVSHGEQLRPLLLVERDRKASEAVDRHPALLAHLEAGRPSTLALEALIFGFEPVELGFQILVRHSASQPDSHRSCTSPLLLRLLLFLLHRCAFGHRCLLEMLPW